MKVRMGREEKMDRREEKVAPETKRILRPSKLKFRLARILYI